MKKIPHVLLLAGTREAIEIAKKLANMPDIRLTASIEGGARIPKDLPVSYRTGGFGGHKKFEEYLNEHEITAVMDATHPFASDITERTARICSDQNIPYLYVLRPPWVPQIEDHWEILDDMGQIPLVIPNGARIFVATGRKGIETFLPLDKAHIFIRQIGSLKSKCPLENGEFVIGNPPFLVEHEMSLFTKLEIDWLVVCNAGGQRSYSKLEAARNLSINVAMISRPELSKNIMTVRTPQQAINWLEQQL